ncbi:hypothetical protein HDU91_007498 [Kappamyces sp. JEL0680]|nr:hypothetical protein HDU91_007498 [Kappamyces sp. JEL0680]
MPVLQFYGKESLDFLAREERAYRIENAWPPSVTRLLGKSSIAVLGGPEHTRLRKLNHSALRPQILAESVAKIERQVTRYIDRLETKTNVVHSFEKLTAEIAIECLLGTKLDESNQAEWTEIFDLFQEFKKGLFSFPLDVPGFQYHKSLQTRAVLMKRLQSMVQFQLQVYADSHESESAKTLLVLLATSPDDEGRLLDLDELAEQALLMYFAGHDTTSSLLISLFDFLTAHPDCLLAARQEQDALFETASEMTQEALQKMKYLEACIQETMRLQTPVGGSFKIAKEDTIYRDKKIEKGTILSANYVASHFLVGMHRAPFHTFEPRRWEGYDVVQGDSSTQPLGFTALYAPFGFGKHSCLGNKFSLMNVKIIMSLLLRKLEWKKTTVLPTRFLVLPLVFPEEPLCMEFRLRQKQE